MNPAPPRASGAPAAAASAGGAATSAALPTALGKEILSGDSRALARGMSLVENGAAEATALLDALYGKKPAAPRIGFTGPPGAGKSTQIGRAHV